jgi:predicted nucleic acid-binding protein
MLLPDVNVWLALTFDSHIHHPVAKSWFDALSGDLCLFCRSTQQGFLRLVTNANVFDQNALTLSEAWQKYDVFQSDPCVSYVDEPVGSRRYGALTLRDNHSRQKFGTTPTWPRSHRRQISSLSLSIGALRGTSKCARQFFHELVIGGAAHAAPSYFFKCLSKNAIIAASAFSSTSPLNPCIDPTIGNSSASTPAAFSRSTIHPACSKATY